MGNAGCDGNCFAALAGDRENWEWGKRRVCEQNLDIAMVERRGNTRHNTVWNNVVFEA